jgi:hypothetical protein
MVKPPPISLRIRSTEATGAARRLLRELDRADLLQRRVKLQAGKALAAIYEMKSVAEPKLRSMSRSNSERWNADFYKVTEILSRIIARGV